MLAEYDAGRFFDEMMRGPQDPRPHYRALYRQLNRFTADDLTSRQKMAQLRFLREGITFTVYGDDRGTERTMPFDFVPRIIAHEEWARLERGLIQRVSALNQFLDDVYHDQQILKDGVVPRALVVTHPNFRTEVAHVDTPHGVHIFLAGIDLVRDGEGTWRVLEDNVRNPSGMAYVFRNRNMMRSIFPELFYDYAVQSLRKHFEYLSSALGHMAPHEKQSPNVVLLTPGIFNAAYFDHCFLAQQLGIELVEGRDMVVIDRKVFMKTTRGLRQVDVIYRRIDDAFLDPLEFNPESLLGVSGLVDALRAGNVSIANGIGNGVADSKATYAYVPDMIRYYLGEEPVLQSVPTYLLSDPDKLEYVLDHLGEMVVKPADGAGGYHMLVGPQATREEISAYRDEILAAPDAYVAQPTLALSRIPTFGGSNFSGCHVDLRPFVICGEKTRVIPGGLTRVALTPGSLVVNSSQGGGGKDTWVLEPEEKEDTPC